MGSGWPPGRMRGLYSVSRLLRAVEVITAAGHPVGEFSFAQRGEHGAFGQAFFAAARGEGCANGSVAPRYCGQLQEGCLVLRPDGGAVGFSDWAQCRYLHCVGVIVGLIGEELSVGINAC